MYYHLKFARQEDRKTEEPLRPLLLRQKIVHVPGKRGTQVARDRQFSLALRRELWLRQRLGQSLLPTKESLRRSNILSALASSRPQAKQKSNIARFLWTALLAVAIMGGLFFVIRAINLPGTGTLLKGVSTLSPSYFVLHGLLAGLPLAASVGPVGVLCMQRTVSHGPLYGFLAGLGRSVAMTLYSALAAFGMTVVTSFLVQQQVIIHILGGLLLVYLGFKTLVSRPAERAADTKAHSLGGEVLATFLLSLTNPLAILLFAASFTSLGIGGAQGSLFSALLVVLGVFLGTLLWNGFTVGAITLLRTLLRNTWWMVWVNRISGGWIVYQGGISLFSVLSSVFA